MVWLTVLGCSNLSILFPIHRLCVIIVVFFGIFIWMNILAETIRFDEVYEELTPTNYCKTNKKTLPQPPALYF